MPDQNLAQLQHVLDDLFTRSQAKATVAAAAMDVAAPPIATAGTELSPDAIAGMRYLLADLQSVPELEAIHEVLRARLFRPATKAVLVSAIHDAQTVGRNALLQLDDWGPGEPRFSQAGRMDEDKRDRNRILLVIHGTFSSSSAVVGYFQPQLQDAIDRTYSAVLAYDHYTLTLNPRQNAEDLRRELTSYLEANNCAETHTIDIICHSRGGLVTRCLVEQMFDPRKSPFRHVHFVATPNGGTHLASPESVSGILKEDHDALALGGFLLGSPLLGELLNQIDTPEEVRAVLHLVPGLDAMDPHGTFVPALNSDPPATFPMYSGACADHEPDGVDHADPWYATAYRRLAKPLGKLVYDLYMSRNHKDGIQDYEMDRIFAGHPNDLVVDTDTVLHIHPRRANGPALPPERVLCFAHPRRFKQWQEENFKGVEMLRGVQRVEDGNVSHSTFFAHPVWNEFVAKQLEMV